MGKISRLWSRIWRKGMGGILSLTVLMIGLVPLFAAPPGWLGALSIPSPAAVYSWTDQSSPTTLNLNSIQILSSTEGWAVGGSSSAYWWQRSGSAILQFNGYDWKPVNNPTSSILRGVSMVSSAEGWAVGDAGAILRYNANAWNVWRQVAPPTVERLNALQMLSAADGWAVGDNGTILHFDGASWRAFGGPSSSNLNAIQMLGSTSGWIVGENGVMLRYDGTSWRVVSTPTTLGLKSISMWDANNGWAVGSSGMILRYDGTQWSQVTPRPTTNLLRSVRAIAANDVWAMGGDSGVGVVLHFTGSTWDVVSYPVPSSISSINMVSSTEGWAVADEGRFLRYDGTAWSSYFSPINTALHWVNMVTATEGWAVGSGGRVLKYSRSGGWQVVTSPTRANLNGVHLIATDNGWAVGDAGTLIYYDGTAWRGIPGSPTFSTLWSVFMVSTSDGWAVGDNGAILRYRSGTWSTFQTPTSDHLRGVHFLSATDGWAVGANGRVLHFDGATWQSFSRVTTADLWSVYMVAANDVWAVGENGTIIHYDGQAWRQVRSGVNFSLRSVNMVSATEGWAVGGIRQQRDPILRYIDGAWGVVSMNTQVPNLRSMSMLSSTEGWAVGDSGTILHYSSGSGFVPPTVTPSPTPTLTPSPTATPEPVSTATPGPTPTFAPTATPTATSTPTATPTPTTTPSPTLPPPFIQAVNPTSGSNGVEVTISIKGKDFQATPSVTLGDRSLTKVTFVSATALTAAVPAGMTPGAYDLVVVNPDGQKAGLLKAFTTIGANPILSEIRPTSGGSDMATDVEIIGLNFSTGITLTLDSTPLQRVSRIGSGRVSAVVPAGLTPGTYSLSAMNPGVAISSTLQNAFTVVDVRNDDLYLEASDIWMDPPTVREGNVVNLGSTVHRRGGKTTFVVDVDFYVGDPNSGGVRIGSTSTPPLSPRGTDSAYISWNLGALRGDITVYGVIDPEGKISESTKANNKVSRVASILPPAADRVPPSVSALTVNGGAESTANPQVNIAISGEDNPGGVGLNSMFFVEREFNTSARQWVPVQQSGWMTYTSNYSMTLTSRGGVRYVQAWVSDKAGNISVNIAKTRINVTPVTDAVAQNQVRLYRRSLTKGQTLAATLATTSGDADLYVWNPGGTRSWVSNLSGTALDSVNIAAALESGIYQIEVYGYLDSTYTLSFTGGSASSLVSMSDQRQVNQDKVERSSPIIESTYEPEGVLAIPKDTESPMILTPLSTVYLPSVAKNASGGW